VSARKLFIAGALLLLLGGLNVYKYSGSKSSSSGAEESGVSLPRMLAIPTLHVSAQQHGLRAKTTRDLFAFVATKPPKPAFVPAPTVSEVVKTGPDPLEVALEAARVHMLNVHIKGILSSQDDLSTIVNAPFFSGTARVGTNLGQGIVVEAISADRVTIRHSELRLQRDILVE
jgi:hypothetical protein